MKAMARLGGWKVLRSMRTAIWLLLALVAATFVASIVPQRLTDAQQVEAWAETNSLWYQIGERLRLFDVFVSPWYIAIYVSLLFVLVLCLIPRTRDFARTWKRATARPKRGELPNLPHSATFATSLAPDEALARARSVLGRRRFRRGPANDDGQFIAEKGSLREGGSLVFHWSFFLILAAFFVSRAFGFEGFLVVVEGETVSEAPVNIVRYNPGWFGDSAHRNFELRLEDFDVEFRDDRSAADFVSRVTVIDEGKEVLTKAVRVNDPLDYRGVKIYQSSFGWAARMVVEDSGGDVVFDDFVTLDPGGPRNTWTGVAKIPSIQPQAGFELFFFPTALVVEDDAQLEELGIADDELGNGVKLVARDGPPTADSPLLLFYEYRGNLGLDRPQFGNELDRERIGRPVELGFAEPDGAAFETADGLSVSFPELAHYSVFKVKRDPGLWLALIAAICVFAGLMASLYISRRRLWVWVRPTKTDTGKATVTASPDAASQSTPKATTTTLVSLGGLAYQRKGAFETEFDSLEARLRSALDAAPDRTDAVEGDTVTSAEPRVGRDDNEPAVPGDNRAETGTGSKETSE